VTVRLPVTATAVDGMLTPVFPVFRFVTWKLRGVPVWNLPNRPFPSRESRIRLGVTATYVARVARVGAGVGVGWATTGGAVGSRIGPGVEMTGAGVGVGVAGVGVAGIGVAGARVGVGVVAGEAGADVTTMVGAASAADAA
jgi:hypothetical protein